MPRLVSTPTKQFDETQTGILNDLIAQSARKDEHYFRMMRVLRNLMRGDHWEDLKLNAKQKELTRIVINLAHAHTRSLLPTLFFKNPTLRSVPTSPIHEGKQETWDALGNNTFPKIGFDDVVKEVVFDSIVYPEACFKWVINKPLVEGEKEDSKTGGVESGISGPTVWLSKGTPVPTRISPAQVIVDYLAPQRDFKQARFVTIRYLKILEELREDKRYKIPGNFQSAGGVTGTSGTTNKRRPDPFELIDSEPERLAVSDHDSLVVVYETWIHQLVQSKSYQQVVWTMPGAKKPIRQPLLWTDVLGEGFDEYPLERLVLNPIPDSLPTSELGAWHSIQVALNWIISRLS